MKKIVCILLLVGICFSLMACALQEGVEAKEEEYGCLQCKEIRWDRNESVEFAVHNWSTYVPDAKIEDILIRYSNQYNEYGVIYIFYRVPID